MDDSPLTHLAQICSSIGTEPSPTVVPVPIASQNGHFEHHHPHLNRQLNGKYALNHNQNSHIGTRSTSHRTSSKHSRSSLNHSNIDSSSSPRNSSTPGSGPTTPISNDQHYSSQQQQHQNQVLAQNLLLANNVNNFRSASSLSLSPGSQKLHNNIQQLAPRLLPAVPMRPQSMLQQQQAAVAASAVAATSTADGQRYFGPQMGATASTTAAANYANANRGPLAQYQNYYAPQQQQQQTQQQQSQQQQQLQLQLQQRQQEQEVQLQTLLNSTTGGQAGAGLLPAALQYNQLIAEAQQQQFANLLLAYQQHQRHIQASHPAYCLCATCLYMRSMVFR